MSVAALSPSMAVANGGGGGGGVGGDPHSVPTDRLHNVDLGRYEQTGVLGEGTFGVVVKARDPEAPSGGEIAIKLLPRGDFVKNFKTYVKREIVHQSSLKHPFIVSLKEVFITQTHLAIAMEYAQGGDMFKYICRHKPHCRLLENQARWIFQQLIIGLDYCHSKGVANRDLKLENLLLDRDGSDGTRPLLKICDFGYSKHEQNSSAKTGVGTPIYMAPEIIYGGNRYDAKKADIWSCGVILYAMLYGCYPFSNKEQDYIRKIVTASYHLPSDISVTPECKDLLVRLLVADPERRMSMDEIKAHTWFSHALPTGALHMNDWYMSHPSGIDEARARTCTLTVTPRVREVMGRIDSLIAQAQKRGYSGEPVVSVTF